jgi:hypothetical protein
MEPGPTVEPTGSPVRVTGTIQLSPSLAAEARLGMTDPSNVAYTVMINGQLYNLVSDLPSWYELQISR